MKKFTIALLLVGMAATPVALAHAHPRQRAARAAAISRLQLSAEQKEQLRALRDSQREKHRPLFEQARAKRQQLRSLRQANDPAAEQVQAELRQMREQMRAARLEAREQFLAVLTAEQRAQLDQMREQRRERRGR